MSEKFFDDSGRPIKTVRVKVEWLGDSQKAVKYNIDGKTVWIPQSQILWDDTTEIVIPEWLAIKNNLI